MTHGRGWVGALAITASLGATARAQEAPAGERSFAALVRSLVLDSLVGGGTRPGERLAAGDTATAALLRRAGLSPSRFAAGDLTCPGATGSDDRPVPPPFGYEVTVTVSGRGDAARRIVAVSKRCSFVYRGRIPRPFYESGTWEVRRSGGRWRVARQPKRMMT